jgi:hypothetical protein
MATIGNELRAALGVETDVLAFNELIDSNTPQQASAGTTAANTFTDLAWLLSQITMTAASKLFFVAASNVAKLLATRNNAGTPAFPGTSPQGGQLLGAPLLISDGLADGTLLLLDGNQIAVGDDGVTLDQSRQATVQLDSDPTTPPTGPTSLWQQNLRAVKVERLFGVRKLANSAVALVTGVA